MHFSVNASDINAGMSLVSHALTARPMRQIYDGVLIESAENGIFLTCTDGEMTIRTRVNAMVVEEGVRDAKKAQLYFRTLEMKDGRAMVEIRLLTGRHHQIRVQMAHAHMPLAGDRKYGGGAGEDGRLCLCAARLCFTHPGSGRRMEFTVTPGFSL